ncbi:mitotic interactor and substrate of PLK1 [Salarias fasciatus]|uniref:mitotic interactor and substrate of PLK1 n=1 Tax=Salarias fasciatus TaxID=181472 RepID=UPI0011767AC2|nr:mitotic interactor and substrate of PLK1-like [Salarias fasciatus]
MENDSWDESQSDSGVSADFSPGSTMEGNPASISSETPIEREIRLSVERENNLRKSRGLPSATSNSQYVQIPLRKAVLTQSNTGKVDKNQDKDREFTGKVMRQEIYEETQREQDLVKLGKIPGIYDKGTVRQMKERKQIFEAFQTPSESVGPARSKTPSWSAAGDASNLDSQEKTASLASTIKGSYPERDRSFDATSPTQSSNAAKAGGSTNSTSRGPGFSEGTGFQVVIIENNMDVPADKWYSAKPVAVTVVDSGMPYISPSSVREEEEEEEELTPQDNPFFKLRSSTSVVKVQQDIQETHEREKELRKQRRSLYGDRGGAKGGEGGGGRSDSTDGRSLALSPSLNGLTAPDLSGSSSREETGLSAAHQSVGKWSVKPPAQAEGNKMNQPEVLPTPWSPRQKTPLVQRWESGLLNGHGEEDD